MECRRCGSFASPKLKVPWSASMAPIGLTLEKNVFGRGASAIDDMFVMAPIYKVTNRYD